MRYLTTRAFIALAFAAGTPALAEITDKHHLREEFTGSHISKPVAGWSLPLDKTYDELTPEDRAQLHSFYPGLKPGDEPPFPRRGLKPVMRNIIELQQSARAVGEAYYGVRVDASGIPQAIAVYKSPGDRFTQAIAYYLINTDYKPAKCDGKPCEGEYRFHFNFAVGR